MPYQYTDIEKQKTWVIWGVFAFLTIFYFVVAELLWLPTRFFFIMDAGIRNSSTYFLTEGRDYGPALFTLKDAMVVFFIALLIAAVHWYLSTDNVINKLIAVLGAERPDPRDSYHNMFANIVAEVCVATGGQKIQPYIVRLPGLNAFAISDSDGNAVIGVTEGLIAKLSRSQLEAVVGHEAAHIVSGDSFITTAVCALFGIYSAMCLGLTKILKRSAQSGIGRLGPMLFYMILLYVILSVTRFLGLLLNMFLSREQEYRADAVAVRLTRDPISLAEAIYVIARGWRGIGSIPQSLSPIFITNPDYSEMEESKGFISNLFSTHPPTNSRIDVLLSMAHADAQALKGAMKQRPRILPEDGLVEVQKPDPKNWLLYKDREWQGPFGAAELLQLDLTPDSWVSRVDEKNIEQVSEDKELSDLLSEGAPAADPGGKGLCPECKQPLNEVLYEGAPVLTCRHCEGYFIPRDIVGRIMIRQDVAISPEAVKLAETTSTAYARNMIADIKLKVVYSYKCPKCNNQMRHGVYSYAYFLEVDQCDNCNYVWFGKNELEALQYLAEKTDSDDEWWNRGFATGKEII